MICYRIGLENPIVMEMQTISTHFFLQCTSRVSPIVKWKIFSNLRWWHAFVAPRQTMPAVWGRVLWFWLTSAACLLMRLLLHWCCSNAAVVAVAAAAVVAIRCWHAQLHALSCALSSFIGENYFRPRPDPSAIFILHLRNELKLINPRRTQTADTGRILIVNKTF